jgi:hypothetical protein
MPQLAKVQASAAEPAMVRIHCLPEKALLTDVDEASLQPRRFLVQVEETLKTLLSREDSDGNYQITIDDKGPKVRCTTATHACVT